MPGAMPLLIFLIFLCLTVPTLAFGAGAIPNYAYLNEKAYRHGDIAEVLLDLVKHVGGGSFVRYTFSVLLGRNKFSKMDMQRVYFGNWLRDYSQAMDIAGLKELTAQTIIMVVSVLGFMTFGFATAEFEITPERLGVYLPVEHIDNPKGYGENEPEGDARQFHSALRPPVDPRELEINPHNGMKNYIATEGEAWDTSSAHVRRTLRECIALGRKANGKEGNDQYEAFRLLGTALHTLEDLLAHSNWCELALRKLGHKDVFCHVGDSVVIDTPNGPSPPLVTGTFGSADFIYSVLGEGMDRLSEASISNLAEKMDKAKSQSDNVSSILKGLLAKLPSSGNTTHDEKMEQAENIKNRAYNFNPDDVAPEEIQHLLWHILEWRDTIYKDVLKVIGMVPGLSELFEELSEALNAFIYTILDPVLKPVLQEAKDALQEGSKAIIDNHDQYQVFDDPNASDPSHSMLAKDHFDLLLNDPAGKIAQVVVEHTVNWIVLAWGNEHEDVELVIDKILEVFHHPYFSNGRSHIQRRMLDRLAQWLTDLGPEKAEKTIQALTKESIREGKNKRFASSEEPEIEDDARIVVEEQTGTMQPVKVIVEDRGTRYEPQPGRPLYERFDGQHQPVRVRTRKQRHVEKTDEEFWRNPYAMRSPQRSHTEGFNWRLYAGNASYAGHRTVTDGLNADGNIFAPSILLAEAESGYRAVFHKIQDSTNTEESRSTRRQHHKRRPETPGVGPSQRGPQASYKKGIYEDGSREVLAASGEPRWHGSVFERFDTSRESRDGAGATSSYQSEAPPAFFVRNLHPEGIYAAQNPFWDEAADDDIPSYGNRPLLYGYGDPDKKYK